MYHSDSKLERNCRLNFVMLTEVYIII